MKTTGYPTEMAFDFRLRHLHGDEISNVFYGKDKNFCGNKDCEYRILLKTENTYRVDFRSESTGKLETIDQNYDYFDVLSPYL